MTDFASQVEVVYMSVENSQGKTYQKPYMHITDFNNKEVYIQLRDDLNVPEFSRILIAALDYNTVSVAAKFAPMREPEEHKSTIENMLFSKNDTKEVTEDVSPFTMD